MPIVTLLTDYGTRDYYAAAVKGVICTLAPEARIIDITHDIEPFNVAQAAFVLRQALPWYPAGTIHVAVVDPGVGSDRRILLGQYAGQLVLAPDNGLLTWVHRDFPAQGMHVVEDSRLFLREVSPTFHGRDILAAAAAHLANGVRPRSFGRTTDTIQMLPVPNRAEPKGGGWLGRVVYVDRFGTLVTNIHNEQLGPVGSPSYGREVLVNGHSIGPIRRAFHEAPRGAAVAMIGGSGLLEIAVNQGRAADRFSPPEVVRVEVR
jgi:S-adenosylmethionine hydrolase